MIAVFMNSVDDGFNIISKKIRFFKNIRRKCLTH